MIGQHASLPAPGRERPFALWRLGFRPFYLLASLYAAISLPLWAAHYAGWIAMPHGGVRLHAHEMLFGFTLAVITGFLFTAVRNWTNRPTPSGAALAAIVALWIAARVAALTSGGWPAVALDVAFAVVVAIAIAIPIVASRNYRNLFFVGLLLVLAAAALASGVARMGATAADAVPGLTLGLDVVLFIVSVVAGRVIPMFTNNGVPGANARRQRSIERIALGGVLAITVADIGGLRGLPLAALLAAVAMAHTLRWLLWQPWRTFRVPLVWVLHAAYAWIPVHLALRALAEVGVVAAPLATHALTVGAISGMIIGMMTRTARGHTGRPLRADRFEVAAYSMVLGAAVVRVLVPLAVPALYQAAVLASATLWAAGFALYAVRYWPVLTRPRVDGKPG